MRADTVFIGGGLAALVAGIKLLNEGQNVIIVSAGQSALHFSSGSFCLLNRFQGKDILKPIEFIDYLPTDHPYIKIGGSCQLKLVLEEAIEILQSAGIELNGSFEKNHYRLTPLGLLSPAWMTLSDHLTIDDPQNIPFKKAAVIGIEGFLDFFPSFISKGLTALGVETIESNVNIKEFNVLRENPTEMRAPNIARALSDEAIEKYAQVINRRIYDSDIAIIPAVVGLNDTEPLKKLNNLVDCPLYSVSTIPIAVPGIRMKIMLQHYFTQHGGWYLLGDTVTDGKIVNNRLESVKTSNLGNTSIKASNYILSSGGLFSRGLKSDIEHIYEPVFNVDVVETNERTAWYDRNFYHSQPFMKFGVKTNAQFKCFLNGNPLENLYAIGGILGGDFDPLYDGVGAGVSLASAIYVANNLIKQTRGI